MITLDRMDLADCFTPEDLVKEIFRQCPTLTPPIPVIEIAKAAGIKEVVEMELANIGGMLVADDAKNEGVILHHIDGPLGRKRFTIGHELGHFLLPKHGAEQRCLASSIKAGANTQNNNDIETEANQFAQLLLMPDQFVTYEINRVTPDIDLLLAISKKFEMSFEAMANKCTKQSTYPFALVYSHHGDIRYCWRNWKSFEPKIPLKKGDKLPTYSHAAHIQQPNDSISQFQQVDPSIWLENGYEEICLEEQTFTQRDGYQVTLLRIRSGQSNL
mgnify:CR=1 FL=1